MFAINVSLSGLPLKKSVVAVRSVSVASDASS